MCVGEVFGDAGSITPAEWRVARLVTTDAVMLLDLERTNATGAGTIAAIGSVGERQTTQAWARWWYTHPRLSKVDGLRYTSAHTGLSAVALWERVRGKLALDREWTLDDPSARPDLELAAHKLHLPIF